MTTAAPLPLGEVDAQSAAGEGVRPIDKLYALTRLATLATLSQPNSGLPEFGAIEWLKSDKSDFNWEREKINAPRK